MITEDYVSFETAKLLKEKGFVVDNISTLIGNDNHPFISGNSGYEFLLKNEMEVYPAPTLQMAMKWLREVHELYIEVSLTCLRKDKNAKIFDASIFKLQNQRYKKLGNIQGYEKACEAAIKYCLENLIKNDTIRIDYIKT